MAVGVAEPWSPPTPGIELAAVIRRGAARRVLPGQRVLIIGKQNSGFELASGMLPWARSAGAGVPVPHLVVGGHDGPWWVSGRATSSRSRTRCWVAA